MISRILLIAVSLCVLSQAANASPATLAVAADRQVVITLANPYRPGLGGAASTWQGWNWTGGYRVSAAVRKTAQNLTDDYALRFVAAWPISLIEEYCVVYEIPRRADRDEVIASLAADPRVSLAQPLQEFTTVASADKGRKLADPYRRLQHALQTIAVLPVHDVATGKGIRVAIVDTGAQLTHPDIASRIAEYEDFVERPGDLFEDDIHGTAVAGIIAADQNNGVGIVGVAPGAELVILKACWPVVEGQAEARCNSFTIAKALAAAVERKAAVVNLSLTGPPDPLLEILVGRLIDRGVAVVGSAVEEAGRPTFPTSIAEVIAVGNTAGGIVAARLVPAPGVDIITTVPNADYRYMTGTSFSTAHVSGLIALQRQIQQELSPGRSNELLIASIQADGDDDGSVDACRVVAPLMTSPPSCLQRPDR